MYLVELTPITDNAQHDVLTYFSSSKIKIGSIVETAYGRSKIRGIVSSISPVIENKSRIKKEKFILRKIDKVIREDFYRDEYIKSLEDFSQKKYLRIGKLISLITPSFVYSQNILPYTPKKYQTKIHTLENTYKEIDNFIEKICIENSEKKIWILEPTIILANDRYQKIKHQKKAAVIHSKIQNFKNISQDTLIYITTPQNIGLIEIFGADIIIVNNEGNGGYRINQKPTLDSRELILDLFTNKVSAIFFIDTLLSFKTRSKNYLTINSQLNTALNFKIVSKTNEEFRNPIFLNKNIEKIFEDALKTSKKILLVNQKTGFASKIVCSNCKKIVSCKKCGENLKFSMVKNIPLFVCSSNKKHTESPLQVCSECRNWNLIPLGIGTDTIKEYIQKKYQHEAALLSKNTDISDHSIYITNETGLMYANRKLFDTTIVISFDSMLYSGYYNVEEKLFRLLYILKQSCSTLYFQTRIKDSDFLKEMREETLSWIETQLTYRKNNLLPPFSSEYTLYSKDKKNLQELNEFLVKNIPLYRKNNGSLTYLVSEKDTLYINKILNERKEYIDTVEIY